MKKTFGGWKVLFAAFALILTLGATREPAYAETPDHLGEMLDGSKLTDEQEAEDTVTPRLRSSFLAQGFVKIVNKGNGQVAIGGSTDCFVTCDVVKFNLYLERSHGDSNFSSYRSYQYVAYNENLLARSLTCSVEKGYYYRLRGYHYASKGGQAENLISRTDGIYIG